jgi:hypothetical protein
MSLSAEAKRRLDEDGFLALEGFLDPDFLAELRRRLEELFAEEGERAGWEFKQEVGLVSILATPTSLPPRPAARGRLDRGCGLRLQASARGIRGRLGSRRLVPC